MLCECRHPRQERGHHAMERWKDQERRTLEEWEFEDLTAKALHEIFGSQSHSPTNGGAENVPPPAPPKSLSAQDDPQESFPEFPVPSQPPPSPSMSSGSWKERQKLVIRPIRDGLVHRRPQITRGTCKRAGPGRPGIAPPTSLIIGHFIGCISM